MRTPLFAALALSLAGNALALAYYARSSRARVQPALTGDSPDRVQLSSAATEPNAAITSKATGALLAPDTWQQLTSGRDPQSVIARLRAAGFPSQILRAVAERMINEEMRAKNPSVGIPFFKRNSLGPAHDEALQAFNKERTARLEAVLGDDMRLSRTMDPEAREIRFGKLSDEKIEAILRIEGDYNEVRSRVFAMRKGADEFQQTWSQIQAIEKEKREDLLAALTPEELRQYEMRTSNAGIMLIQHLRRVEVDEREFNALYDVQKSFHDRQELLSVNDPNSGAERMALHRLQNDEMQRILGNERFFRYLEETNPGFGVATKFTAGHANLPADAGYQLFRLQTEAQELTVRRTMPAAERQETLAGINQRLETLLGPRLAEEFRKHPYGRAFIPTGPQPVVQMGFDAGK